MGIANSLPEQKSKDREVADDDLLINIEVDSNQAAVGLGKLSKELLGTDKQARKVKKAIADLQKTFRGAAQVANSLGTAARKMGIDTTENLEATRKEAGSVRKSLAKLADAADAASKSTKTLGQTLSALTKGIASQISAIRVFVSALDDLTNPDTLLRLSKLSKILSYILLAKGFSTLSKVLRATSAALEEFAGKLKLIRSVVFENLRTEVLATRAAMLLLPGPLAAVAKGIGFIGTVAKISVGGVKTFVSGIQSLNNVVQSTAVTFSSLASAFEAISDPERIRKLASLAKILAAILFAKGKRDIAEQIFKASDAIDGFADKIESIKGQSLEELAGKVSLLRSLFSVMDTTVEAATVSAVGFVGLGLANTFKEIGPGVDRTNLSLAQFLDHFKRISRSPDIFKKGLTTGFTKAAADVRDFTKSATKSGGALAKSLTPGIIGATEAGIVLGPVLFALGRTAAGSENDFVRFAGTLTTVVAVSLAGFSAVVTTVVAGIGALTAALGDKLIGAMTAFEEKAAKAESVTSRFEFVLKGFARTAGEEAVGSLALWNKTIDGIVKNSTIGATELRKSVKLLVAEGQALSLSVSENTAILQRASDVAASTGLEVSDVSLRIAKALGGNAEALKALGIFVDDASLKHSEFVKEQGIVLDSLDLHSKAQLRLNEIMRQTSPLVGAAAAELATISGATEKYDQAVLSLQESLGAQGKFTILYTNALTNLLTALVSLPQPIKDAAGVSIDFLGVSLKILGTIVKYSVTIASLITAYKFLAVVVANNVVLQGILTGAFNFVAASVGVQAVAVTSLSAAWTNLLLILKGSVVVVFKTIGTLLLSVSAKMAVLTKAVLTNPLFFKVGVLILGISALIKAYRELQEEFKRFEKPLDKVAEQTGDQIDLWGELSDIIKKVTRVTVQLTKLSLVGLFKIVEMTKLAALGWQMMWAKITDNEEALRELNKEGIDVLERLDNLGQTGENALAGVLSSFDDVAEAAEDTANNVENLSKQFKRLSEIEIDTSGLRVSIFGNEFERSLQKFKEAQTDLNKVLTGIVVENDGKRRLSNEKEIAEAKTAFHRAELEFLKLREDELTRIFDIEKSIQAKLRRDQLGSLALVKDNTRVQLKGLRDREDALRIAGALTQKDLENIRKVRWAVIALGKAEEERTKISLQEKYLSTLEKQAKAAQSLEDKLNGLALANLKALGDTQGAQELQVAMKLAELAATEENVNKMFEQGAITASVRDRYLEILEAARQLAKEAPKIKMPELFSGEQVDKIELVFGQSAGQVAGLTSALLQGPLMFFQAANIMLDAALKIINIIPELINKLSDVFNSLADLPSALSKAFRGLGKAFLGLIRNFIPSLIQAVGDIATTILDTLAVALPELLNDLPGLILDAVDKLFQMLPDIALKLGMALINMNWATIALKLITGIIKNLPRLAKTLLTFLIKGIPEMAKQFANGVIIALKQIVNDIANALGFDDVFNIEMPDIGEQFQAFADSATNEASKLFKLLDMEAEMRGLDRAKKIADVINLGIDRFASIWRRLWQWAEEKWLMFIGWLKDRFDAFISGLGEVFSWINEKILQPIADAFMAAFNWLYTKVIEPLAKIVETAWLWVLENIIDPLAGVVKDAWLWVKTNILDKLGSTVSEAFESIKNLGKTIYNGFKEALTGGPEFLKEAGVSIWKGLKGGIGKIGSLVKEQLDKINPANLFKKIFDISGAMGKKGLVEETLGIDVPFLKFATGGRVPGSAMFGGDDKRNDTVPALLSPGEAVIPRSAMDDPNIKHLVDSILSGRIQKMAVGGVVGELLDDVTGGGWSESWSSIGIDEGEYDILSGLGVSFKEAKRAANIGLKDSVTFFQNLGTDGLENFRKFSEGFSVNAMRQLANVGKMLGVPDFDPWGIVRSSVVDRLIPKMLAKNSFHKGGPVGMALGGEVPAMLQSGEFVMRRRAVEDLGLGFMQRVNQGGFGGSMGDTTQNFDITLHIESKDTIDEAFVRNRLMPGIKSEIKKASLRGDFIMSKRGLR